MIRSAPRAIALTRNHVRIGRRDVAHEALPNALPSDRSTTAWTRDRSGQRMSGRGRHGDDFEPHRGRVARSAHAIAPPRDGLAQISRAIARDCTRSPLRQDQARRVRFRIGRTGSQRPFPRCRIAIETRAIARQRRPVGIEWDAMEREGFAIGRNASAIGRADQGCERRHAILPAVDDGCVLVEDTAPGRSGQWAGSLAGDMVWGEMAPHVAGPWALFFSDENRLEAVECEPRGCRPPCLHGQLAAVVDVVGSAADIGIHPQEIPVPILRRKSRPEREG
jgi:hypothetical protein